MAIGRIEWLSLEQKRIAIDRTEGLLTEQNNYIFVIHIMTYHEILSKKSQKHHFFPKRRNYGIFAAKIYDDALIDSF